MSDDAHYEKDFTEDNYTDQENRVKSEAIVYDNNKLIFENNTSKSNTDINSSLSLFPIISIISILFVLYIFYKQFISLYLFKRKRRKAKPQRAK